MSQPLLVRTGKVTLSDGSHIDFVDADFERFMSDTFIWR
jgi:hypothetical protein